MTVLPIRYTLYFWNPPILTPEQEVEAGQQIVMSGGPEVWKKKAPYLPEKERARAEAYAFGKRTSRQVIVAVVALLGFLAIVVFAGPRLWVPLGIVSVTVLALSLYTLSTARNRYHDWVDKVVAAYLNVDKAALVSSHSHPQWRAKPGEDKGQTTGPLALIQPNARDDVNADTPGLPQNFVEMAKGVREEADQGDALRQCLLGMMYETGTGVSQDYVLAHKWFNLAAREGDHDAAIARARLASKMTRDQIAQAQRLAREWKPMK